MGQRELDDKHFSPLSAALTTAPATLVAGTLLAKVGPIQLCFLITKNDDVNQNKHTEVCNHGKDWLYPSWFPNEYDNENKHTSDYLHILLSLHIHV